MKTLLAISGSLRKDSKNTQLLQALKEHFKEKIHIEIYDQMGNLPHFNPDIENDNLKSILHYRKALASADSVLICTPEYAHSIPGSLKNALDWVVGSGELMDKKVGLLFSSSSEEQFVKVQLFEVIKTMSAKIENDMCLKFSGVGLTPEIIRLVENL